MEPARGAGEAALLAPLLLAEGLFRAGAAARGALYDLDPRAGARRCPGGVHRQRRCRRGGEDPRRDRGRRAARRARPPRGGALTRLRRVARGRADRLGRRAGAARRGRRGGRADASRAAAPGRRGAVWAEARRARGDGGRDAGRRCARPRRRVPASGARARPRRRRPRCEPVRQRAPPAARTEPRAAPGALSRRPRVAFPRGSGGPSALDALRALAREATAAPP